MPKYRFRKVYFICEDNQVFTGSYEFVNCYKNKEYSRKVCIQKQRTKIDDAKMLANKNNHVPTLQAEGFYLVHESLFDQILKQHSKEDKK